MVGLFFGAAILKKKEIKNHQGRIKQDKIAVKVRKAVWFFGDIQNCVLEEEVVTLLASHGRESVCWSFLRVHPQARSLSWAASAARRDCSACGCLVPSMARYSFTHPRIILGRQACRCVLMRSATTLIHNASLNIHLQIFMFHFSVSCWTLPVSS